MSKTFAILAACAGTAAKWRRTIEHSPEFSGVQTSEDGRPGRNLPAGGFMTG